MLEVEQLIIKKYNIIPNPSNPLILLSTMDWINCLKSEKFSDEQINQLNIIHRDWIEEFDKDLHFQLNALPDINDLENIKSIIRDCLENIDTDMIKNIVCNANFPNPTYALYYAINQTILYINTTVDYVKMCKEIEQEPHTSYVYTEEQIAKSKLLAEAGLAEDVKNWPVY